MCELLYRVTESVCSSLVLSCLPSIAREQLAWQAQEIGVLIHFNIATYVENHDGCTDDVVPPISLFNPVQLNTNNWAQTIVDLGGQYAVLVAKVSLFTEHRDDYLLVDISMPVVSSWLQQMSHSP